MNFFLVLQKRKRAPKPLSSDKTYPRAPKLGYEGGRAPKLSARGILTTSGAGVVCHMYEKSKTYYTEPTGLIGSIWYYRQELDDEEEDAEEGLPGVEGARRGLLPGHASAGHHKTIQGRQLFLLLNLFMLFM